MTTQQETAARIATAHLKRRAGPDFDPAAESGVCLGNRLAEEGCPHAAAEIIRRNDAATKLIAAARAWFASSDSRAVARLPNAALMSMSIAKIAELAARNATYVAAELAVLAARLARPEITARLIARYSIRDLFDITPGPHGLEHWSARIVFALSETTQTCEVALEIRAAARAELNLRKRALFRVSHALSELTDFPGFACNEDPVPTIEDIVTAWAKPTSVESIVRAIFKILIKYRPAVKQRDKGIDALVAELRSVDIADLCGVSDVYYGAPTYDLTGETDDEDDERRSRGS